MVLCLTACGGAKSEGGAVLVDVEKYELDFGKEA